MLTKDIVIGASVFDCVLDIIRENGLPENILIVYDENTYRATEGKIGQSLKDGGCVVSDYIFRKGVHADEKGVGLLMLAAANKPRMLVSVGSGTICDLSRFCANQMNIPFIVCATAPSMDGYASSVAAMTVSGIKISFSAACPQVIIGDTDVLQDAPMDMIAAGFGDIAGKISALMDWELGRIVTGEKLCKNVAALMNTAVDACFSAGQMLAERSETAIAGLMRALTISGVAMQLNGNSRPASGSEHHISHFLEMTDQESERIGAYHGAKVGIASLITLRLYEKMFFGEIKELKIKPSEQAVTEGIQAAYKGLAEGILRKNNQIYIDETAMFTAIGREYEEIKKQVAKFPEKRKKIVEILSACSGAVKPQDLGYTREMMRDAIVYGRFVRGRFTILSLLANWGLLEQYADEVLDEIL